jgi:arylsulfatase A-like enzyme
MMTYFDDTVGEFVKSLVDANMWDNTLMLFTTDNGGMVRPFPILPSLLKGAGCNYPLRSGKGTAFEGGVRGTAFVTGGLLPQDARGTVRTGLMHSTDVYSTLLSSAGITSLSDTVDGVDQLGMIMKGAQSPRTSIAIFYSLAVVSQCAIIEGEMKLINSSAPIDGYWTCGDQKKHRVPRAGWIKRGKGMLFNLTADPNEAHNLIDELPEVAAKLHQLLAEAAASAVPAQTTEADPLATDWMKAHNHTMGPWADEAVPLLLTV